MKIEVLLSLKHTGQPELFIELDQAVKPWTDNKSEFLAPHVSMGPFHSEVEFRVWQEAHPLCPMSFSCVPHPVATSLP